MKLERRRNEELIQRQTEREKNESVDELYATFSVSRAAPKQSYISM